jgi:hypothetical protein
MCQRLSGVEKETLEYSLVQVLWRFPQAFRTAKVVVDTQGGHEYTRGSSVAFLPDRGACSLTIG